MSITEYVKTHAGRWFDRNFLPQMQTPPLQPLPVPAAAPVVFDPESAEDGTGIWLPAGLVEVGDQVHLSGRWHTVTQVAAWAGDPYHPARALLFFGTWQSNTGYYVKLYVRDVAAVIAAEIRGAK